MMRERQPVGFRPSVLAVMALFLVAAAGFGQGPPDQTRRTHFPIDHVAVIFDDETLDAMAESPLLQNEFANSGGRKSEDGGTWEAFYLYGLHTQYLEFVSRVRQPGLQVAPGDGMIAFNAETEGSIDWIIGRMKQSFPESNPTKSIKTLARSDEKVPYAHVATFNYETGHEGIGAWALELHQEFKHRMSGGRAEIGDISRARIGPPVRHDPDKYFRDVVSVTVAVTDTRRVHLLDLLTELGYETAQFGEATVCKGKENVIELVPKTHQKYAITRMTVSLTRTKEGRKVYRFGPDVVLTFGEGPEAVWEFGRVGLSGHGVQAAAQSGSTPISAPAEETREVVDTVGTFRPTGQPEQPRRVPIGDKCVIDLKQEYALDGALTGLMQVDFRIIVDGPCGVPPGTHDEHWIAHGQYSVEVDDEGLAGSLTYLATVEAGGRVDGTIELVGGLNGLLEVRGSFTDGFMRYRGNLRRDAAPGAAAN